MGNEKKDKEKKDNIENDDGKVTRLTFLSKAGQTAGDAKPNDKGLDKFEVMINPDRVSRKLSLSKTDNKSHGSKSKGEVVDSQPEQLSFSFYLDGTGVVMNESSHAGESVRTMIDQFLSVTYKKGDKPIQSLHIKYVGQTFLVQTSSIDIEYTLFDKNGEPLRAHVTCSFSTIKETTPGTSKSNTSKGGKGHSKKVPPAECPVPQPCDCSAARSCGQNSLHEPLASTPANANYMGADGQAYYKS